MSEQIEQLQSEQEYQIEEIVNSEDASPVMVTKEEYDSLYNKYLMKAAEFENYTKRVNKQYADFRVMQDKHLLEIIIPALNNLYTSAITSGDDGITLLLKSFKTALNSAEIEIVIPHIGDTFDCDNMEAVRVVPAPDDTADNTVVEIYSPGYKLKNKWIAYPKVSVYQS